jgi:nucleoside-diphosphate kinase
MSVERTLSIVKPDAVGRNLIGEILHRFEAAGLRIAAGKLLRLSPERAQAFYAVHKERPFFASLCTYMSSGPIFVSVLEGENAIAKNRETMGATDPAKAAPGIAAKTSSKTPSTARMERRPLPVKLLSFSGPTKSFDDSHIYCRRPHRVAFTACLLRT